MKLWGWTVVVALALSTFAGAQETKKPEPKGPLSIAGALHKDVSGMEQEFVGAAEAMPEDKYNYAPTQGEFKGVRDFATQVKHVAAVNYILGGGILGEKPPAEAGAGENGPDSVKTKAEVLKYLKDSFAYAHKSLNGITAKNATASVKSPFGDGDTTRLNLAVILVGHGFNHYGQMVEYLRLNGIVPPASRPQPQQK